MLKLYNTLGHKKQNFKSINKKEVRMYSCGLTVYNYGHIGNYRAFVASDILRRYLEYKKYKVKKIVNITDVDDKTIKGSQSENKSLKDFTKIYEKAFFDDENLRRKCGVSDKEAEDWITTGGSGSAEVPSGQKYTDIIRFNIPEGSVSDVSTCIIRYKLIIKQEDGSPFTTEPFDVDVN